MRITPEWRSVYNSGVSFSASFCERQNNFRITRLQPCYLYHIANHVLFLTSTNGDSANHPVRNASSNARLCRAFNGGNPSSASGFVTQQQCNDRILLFCNRIARRRALLRYPGANRLPFGPSTLFVQAAEGSWPHWPVIIARMINSVAKRRPGHNGRRQL